MLLVICHLSCDVIGYEGSKCDWCFLIHLLSQLDGHWLLVKWSVVSYQQQSYSGPNTPKRSYSTYSWNDSWVQTFHSYTSYFYLAKVNHVQSHGLNQFRAIISTYFLQVKINDGMGWYSGRNRGLCRGLCRSDMVIITPSGLPRLHCKLYSFPSGLWPHWLNAYIHLTVIRELKQRCVWATHINRKCGIFPFKIP